MSITTKINDIITDHSSRFYDRFARLIMLMIPVFLLASLPVVIIELFAWSYYGELNDDLVVFLTWFIWPFMLAKWNYGKDEFHRYWQNFLAVLNEPY